MDHIIQWFFTARGDMTPPTFNYAPWLIIDALALIIPIYYGLEGRRKIPFIKNNPVLKQYVFDPMFNPPQLPVWAMVGFIVMGGEFLDSFFSWHFWLVLWLGWGAGLVIYWLNYFIREHPQHMVNFARYQERAKYFPTAGKGRRAASRR